jgi:hypothetical protein
MSMERIINFTQFVSSGSPFAAARQILAKAKRNCEDNFQGTGV